MTRRAALGAMLAALAGPALAQLQPQHRGPTDHRFDDAESWARIFDNPARDAWQKPDEVVQALALAPNAVVADVGAGTGYFAARLARALPRGRVYAADASPDMVKYLAERAQREQLPNLSAVRAAADGPNLPAPVDLVLLVDVYHHIDDRVGYFRALQGALKPAARVAVIDFKPETRRGPRHKIPASTVREEMRQAGYAMVQELAFLPDQYFLVFAPAP